MLAGLPLGGGHPLGGELGAAGGALGGGPDGGGELLRGGGLGGPLGAGAGGLGARGARGVQGGGVGGGDGAQALGLGAGVRVGGGRGAGAGRADRGAGGGDLGVEGPGPLGRAGLAVERPRAGAHLARDVAGPLQSVRDPVQLLLGPAAAALRHGDAGGGVDHRAALHGGAGAERLDLPLADDGEGVGPDAPPRERLLHVEQAAARGVQAVVGVAGAGQAAAGGHLGRAVRVVAVEHEADLGVRRRGAPRAPRVEDVGHAARPQAAGALLAERPHDGLGEVALAGPVRADDDVDARPELEVGGVGERLEAAKGQPGQHGAALQGRAARAWAAAACSDDCLEGPVPSPITVPPTRTRLVKTRRCGGPCVSVSS